MTHDAGRHHLTPARSRSPRNGLFVYGTLLPGEERWPALAPFVDSSGVRTTVAGDLYDTGFGYPAAIFEPDPRYRGGTIRGRVFDLRADRYDEALAVLDQVEGAVEGLYQRVSIASEPGTVWAYQVGGDLRLTPIPDGDWLAWSAPTTGYGA